MQFSVPQFIEVEDKIIGPLGIKQFLILLSGGLICLGFWSIFKFGIIFFVFAVPIAFITIALTFGKFNGRSLMSNVPGVIKFISVPKVRVFQRTGERELSEVKKATTKAEVAQAQDSTGLDSRLQKLAYLLDQQSAEEKRLINTGQMKQRWLNQI